MSKKDYLERINAEKAAKGLRVKKLLQAYKSVAKEMKIEAKNYNYLSELVETSTSREVFFNYQASWKRLMYLNDIAYSIMYEYRKICGTPKYKVLFFFGVFPKQHSFRFFGGSKVCFRYSQLINLLSLR